MSTPAQFWLLSACFRLHGGDMLRSMITPSPAQSPQRTSSSCARKWVMKITTLLLLGLVFGFAYDWAAPRLYRPGLVPGFRLGVLHGALMPVALPALLVGRDVPIYATDKTERPYKIGYIAGINLCGLIFFGAAFRQPRSH
jgi:hypothetical protein